MWFGNGGHICQNFTVDSACRAFGENDIIGYPGICGIPILFSSKCSWFIWSTWGFRLSRYVCRHFHFCCNLHSVKFLSREWKDCLNLERELIIFLAWLKKANQINDLPCLSTGSGGWIRANEKGLEVYNWSVNRQAYPLIQITVTKLVEIGNLTAC